MKCEAKRDYAWLRGHNDVFLFHRGEKYEMKEKNNRYIVAGLDFTKTDFNAVFEVCA
jgi:hypothetical protein